MSGVCWIWARDDRFGRWYYCEGDGRPGSAISWTSRDRNGVRRFASKEEARASVRQFRRDWRSHGYPRKQFKIIRLIRRATHQSSIKNESLAAIERR
jgi:hypothetical protein